MSVNWNDYEVYDPGVSRPVSAVPRAEARKAFYKCMEEKPVRIEMLSRLLKANGLNLDGSHASIQDLNDWFVANVGADPDNPGRLTPDWCSVVHDVALFLGDLIIQLYPTLRWEFFTDGKKDTAYQRHVIMGFTKVPNPKYNLDLDRRTATYGHRIVASRGSIARHGKVAVRGVEIDVDAAVARQPLRAIEPDVFWQWVTQAGSRA